MRDSLNFAHQNDPYFKERLGILSMDDEDLFKIKWNVCSLMLLQSFYALLHGFAWPTGDWN